MVPANDADIKVVFFLHFQVPENLSMPRIKVD